MLLEQGGVCKTVLLGQLLLTRRYLQLCIAKCVKGCLERFIDTYLFRQIVLIPFQRGLGFLQVFFVLRSSGFGWSR